MNPVPTPGNNQEKASAGGTRPRRVLVTGAGTGIGRGVALAFARTGAQVAVHYSATTAGPEVAAEIIAEGGTAKAFLADFRQPESYAELAAEATTWLGGLDVLVNNAGISLNLPFAKVSQHHFDVLYNVNVKAPYFLTQACLEALQAARGCVINISSIHAFSGRREFSLYAGTKGAIISFTRTLAIELAPLGIRVNTIAPGGVEVESQHKVFEYEAESFGRQIPVGFLGQPSDVADAALFLASPAARYIVGHALVIDGGTTAWFAFSEEYRASFGVTFGKEFVPEP